jgi:hypothetical protein
MLVEPDIFGAVAVGEKDGLWWRLMGLAAGFASRWEEE